MLWRGQEQKGRKINSGRIEKFERILRIKWGYGKTHRTGEIIKWEKDYWASKKFPKEAWKM